MEIKDLFDPSVKEDILTRVNRLTPDSKPLWGKMTVGQMLAHVQAPMHAGLGTRKLPNSWMRWTIGPLIKKMLYNKKPFRRHLPTAPAFRMTDNKDFEREKEALIKMIRNFSETAIVMEIHPIFGRLTKKQWSKGIWKHLDHHLQQFGV